MEPEREIPPRQKVHSTVSSQRQQRPEFSKQPEATVRMESIRKTYSREVCVILGFGFFVVGLLGFVIPYFLNAHLSYAHNVIHLASGLAALWFGFRGEISAKKFCYIFGAIYLVLGMLGFVAGVPGVASIANPAEDRFLWNFMPGILELGTSDHIIHILAGGTFILAGLLNFNIKRRVTS